MHIDRGESEDNTVSTECNFFCYHHNLFAPPEPLVKPTPTDDLSVKERYIRAKYIQRAFVKQRNWTALPNDTEDELQQMQAAHIAAVETIEQAASDGDLQSAYECLVQWPESVDLASSGSLDSSSSHSITSTSEVPKGQISVGMARPTVRVLAPLIAEDEFLRLLTIKNVCTGSALHIACSNNHSVMLELLLLNGAFMNERRSSDGRTALLVAAFKCHWECVEILLAKGADSWIEDKESSSVCALD